MVSVITSLAVLLVLFYVLKICLHLTYDEKPESTQTLAQKAWHIYYSMTPFPILDSQGGKQKLWVNTLTKLFWIFAMILFVVSIIAKENAC